MVLIIGEVGVLFLCLNLLDKLKLSLHFLLVYLNELLGNPSIISPIDSKVMNEVLIS